MATITNNRLLQGLSGRLGKDLVFKTIRGKTIVCAYPRKSIKQKETVAQQKTRTRFQEATQWAKAILQNPTKKAHYEHRAKQLKLPNAYTAAITTYLRKHQVAAALNNNKS